MLASRGKMFVNDTDRFIEGLQGQAYYCDTVEVAPKESDADIIVDFDGGALGVRNLRWIAERSDVQIAYVNWDSNSSYMDYEPPFALLDRVGGYDD
jgi:hypothetical protein